jgi:hypothetical protein
MQNEPTTLQLAHCATTTALLTAAANALRRRAHLERHGAVHIAYWLEIAARDLAMHGAPAHLVDETRAIAAIARLPSTAVRGGAPEASHRIDLIVPTVVRFYSPGIDIDQPKPT